jgi:cytochrome b subunit of formate dehydrogenase
VENKLESTSCGEDRFTCAGQKILFWIIVASLVVAVIGSLVFLSPRFSDFPYAWF